MAITYPALPGQNIVQQVAGATTNGYTQGVNLVTSPQTRGVPVRTLYPFMGTPAAPSVTAVAQSQAITANVAMTLNTGSTPTSPAFGTFVQSIVSPYLGSNCIVLDMERRVTLTFSAAPTAGIVVTMIGYDYRGVAVTQQITTTTGTTQPFVNPISTVVSITFAANPNVNVSVGTDSAIGLPYYLFSQNLVMSYTYNRATVTPIPGTNMLSGNAWRNNGATPINVTIASISPSRGLLLLPSTPDGTKTFVFTYFIMGEDSELNGQLANLNQSSLFSANIKLNVSANAWVMPALTKYDALGMQYPGDLAFATSYNTLLQM